MANAKFTQKDAQRIAKATRKIEKLTPANKADKRRPSAGTPGFWAKITDSSDGLYSFEQLEATINDKLEENANGELITGFHTETTGYAIEATESKSVPNDSIVWMEPAHSQDYYIFKFAEAQGFWAKIGERDPSTIGIKYSWVQLQAKENTDPGLQEGEGLLSGEYSDEEGFAVEADLSRAVPEDSIVWLQPTSENYYIFKWHHRGFWAKITDKTSGESELKYSWVELEAANKDNPGLGTGSLRSGDHTETTGWAIESNSSPWVLKNAIVWMEPTEKDYYVFHYYPGVRQVQTSSEDVPANSSKEINIDGFTVKIYNQFSSKVKKNRKIYIAYSHHDKKWFIISEDCTAVASS